ncbi:hypothetical protein DSL72_002609 [Monilinia vaccinii-corymbosi]|uniref:Uncharacterized protein n=1 Tax=Monilinia vaccinii-corymbosi TaxID=61207 RepID=A0A8A3PD53_9HELO|nr:hypothetical protein DSL72_002609 [Monilinia vaccinii-corymbosi]
MEMEEREEEYDKGNETDDHEFMIGRDEEEGLEEGLEEGWEGTVVNFEERWTRRWKIINPWIWIVFSIWSVLSTRRFLTTDFKYPICFLVLSQIAAYFVLAVFAVVKSLVLYFTSVPSSNPSRGLSFLPKLFILARCFLPVFISMVALMCSVKAIVLFNNLAVFSTLLILTYAFDALIFALAYALRILPRDQVYDTTMVSWALAIFCLASMIVYNDYRLNMEALSFAVLGMFLASLARTIATTEYQMPLPKGSSYGASTHFMLWGGLPLCLAITICAAYKYEDFETAFIILRSMDFSYLLKNLLPGALTHVLWNTALRSTLPLSIGSSSPYELSKENVSDGIHATIHLSLGLLLMSSLEEENALDGLQISIFTLIYVISIGPKEIGLYIPKLVNLLNAIRGMPTRKMHSLWQKPLLLGTTTILFTIVTSVGILYWMDTISIRHDQKNWPGSKSLYRDVSYRAETSNRLQIVIAHSAGESIPAIGDIVTGILSSQPQVRGHQPNVLIYTKDPAKDIIRKIRQDVGFGDIHPLPNIGGASGTFIHHILKNWDSLPTQTLFLTTSPHTLNNFDLIGRRLFDYYNAPPGPPMPENSDVLTGFLNLGEQDTCDCYRCHDRSGWNDTFRLIPSMWSASRPMEKGEAPLRCKKVILTHGNNFIASAARLRGVARDIWETLGEALSDPSLSRGWAHDEMKLGPGGREAKMFGEKDSLEKPHMGYAIERLWGILLGCSNQEIAWKCPNLWRGRRLMGWDKEDCACRD